jgi:hypothetical protein
MPSLKLAGREAMSKWKTHPIGGEIRPELWGTIFDENVSHKQAQDFDQCVQATHVSWLMDTGMMEKKQSDIRIRNASRAVQKMGYEFHVTQASLMPDGDQTKVLIQVRNTGVAPFYHGWKIVVSAFDKDDVALKEWSTDWRITGLLPNEPPADWQLSIRTSEIPGNAERLAFRVVNPLSNGLPLRFANTSDRQQADGWFRIGEIPLDNEPNGKVQRLN